MHQNRLLHYFAVKNEQNQDLLDNYMQRSSLASPVARRKVSESPLGSSLNMSRRKANDLIAKELGGSPVKSKSPYESS